ncbi:MAG: hypothetical protein HF978_18840 [Desulfobacteraceae bacterium]|nr:hypothetical protein [Desulfobacteraceae bacterium]MBC2757605.1 hypothetical protein [Desulfobacteraceae bacterium]
MKIKKNSIIQAAVFYACSVVIAEATFGNPNFPINLWRFEIILAWQWSVPVHAAGFIWLFFCNRLFYDQSIMIPIFVSILFFIACETANWSVFHFFVYEPYPVGKAYPLGSAGSFWLIIFLYSVLCTVTSFLLRTNKIFNKNRPE